MVSGNQSSNRKNCGLNERYVREWLGAMVTGRVVDYFPGDDTYSLPPEHDSWLTREAGLNNLALQAQYIPLLAQVEEPIVECFRNGGGVPYSVYPRFQRLMAEDSRALHDAALVETILPLAPGLLERLRAGIRVADIGCGRGHAINLLTAFDAIHNQAHPALVLGGIARALRPEGVFLMVDLRASGHLDENIDHLAGLFIYTISCMHCMTVSLSQNGAGLGAMWGEQKALRMLAEAGFMQVKVKQVESDLFNNYYIATKG